ncbi:DUF1707 and DUF2154 domain-containing protein [Streptomyces sp. TRM66268-LWL]|uniref:DUF1707 and DUF2154 domain-containing protein n=1 Tax=Streptomyces polyasparticus TaxID=2767826 RepID=A0ABR7STC8_9ACTN|nr:DUF1707 domain-containing protein [Streptomyces polyasparticus]MBC9717598.1 DUF1707 and DUF2154 domain-containing protein [Streptomyces polyasparticus]
MDLEKHPQPEPEPQPAKPSLSKPEHRPEPALADAAPPPVGLRASDADRDRTAEILAAALAEGRLTADEHSERIDGVYRAKTLTELEPYVADLPGAHQARPAAPVGDQPTPGSVPATADENLVAVFSSTTRKGRWRVGRRTHAYAVFGNVEIDLTEAIFEYQQVVIKAVSVFGNVEVRVPENVSLRGSGSGVFGNFEVEALDAGESDAPVVFVDGYAVLGNIEAKPKRGKFIQDLHKYVGRSMARHLRKHLD